MKEHLSSEQFSKRLAGEPIPGADQHLKNCAHCAAETARMKKLLTEFRTSTIAWSAHQKGAHPPEQWQISDNKRRLAGAMMTWKLAAAALVIVLIILIPKNINDRRREIEQLKADVQLWEEVNAQVSQPVPAPLKPLMQLVAWEPETGE
jgi:hypothetical protein